MEGFPVTVKIPVAWGEMDAFGHVNNIVYFRYFETARIKYFEELSESQHMAPKGIGPILAHTSCQYKQPLVYPDTVYVSVRVVSMRLSSYVMECTMRSEKLGEVATAEAVIVTYDYEKQQKAAIPKSLRDSIELMEKRSFSVSY